MLNKSTNIQELYETLIKDNKKIILFGAGRKAPHWIDEINRYIWYLCDDWKTPDYIAEEPVYSYSYNPIEEFVDCLIDHDEEKRQSGFYLNGREVKVREPEYLDSIDPQKYIFIITTERYEAEIKAQLQKIDNIREVPCYSFWSNMHSYKVYNRGLIVDRMILPYMDTIRYNPFWDFSDNEYDIIKKLIEEGEYIANGIVFQITTICNLRCKYCAAYIPKLPVQREMDVDRVLEDIETYFSAVSRCLYVQLASGEALLCSNLDIILEKLLSIEKVQRIEIVTNGVAYPKKERTLELLADPKIIISMSNYNMPDKTNISRKFYKEHGINVRYLEDQKWSIQGNEPYDRNLDREALCNSYMLCDMARICPPQITEGRITSCGKIERYVELTDFSSDHDYFDFKDYQTAEELKKALIRLRLEPYMDGCAWCDVPYAHTFVEPAEQIY